MLDEFIMTDRNLNFDLETAIVVCRQAGCVARMFVKGGVPRIDTHTLRTSHAPVLSERTRATGDDIPMQLQLPMP